MYVKFPAGLWRWNPPASDHCVWGGSVHLAHANLRPDEWEEDRAVIETVEALKLITATLCSGSGVGCKRSCRTSRGKRSEERAGQWMGAQRSLHCLASSEIRPHLAQYTLPTQTSCYNCIFMLLLKQPKLLNVSSLSDLTATFSASTWSCLDHHASWHLVSRAFPTCVLLSVWFDLSIWCRVLGNVRGRLQGVIVLARPQQSDEFTASHMLV